MSSFNLLSLGTQAVRANQTALGVVGQNISNVSTEGYTRQVVHFGSTIPSGVEILDVERVTNSFLTQQYRTDTSNHARIDIYADLALEADNLLGQDVTNISVAMDAFFAEMQNAVDDPTALAHRELLLAQANTLSRRFNDLSANFTVQNDKANDYISNAVDNINLHAQAIASYNDKIRQAQGRGDSVNELMDKRDEEIRKLSEFTDVQVIENEEGMVDVRIARGQPLVVGLDANAVYTHSSDVRGTELNVGIEISGTRTDVTEQIVGGRLGGVFDYRNEVLNPTRNELGRIAITFAKSMNDMQAMGMDLNNELGTNIFKDVNSNQAMRQRIVGNAENRGSYIADVSIKDLSKLSADEFELELTGGDTFRLTNKTTGEVITQDDLRKVQTGADVSDGAYFIDETTGELKIEMEGFRLDMRGNGYLRAGDKFQIQPTRFGADQISVAMSDPRQLALASPVRANTDAENNGTGEISVQVTDVNHSTFTTEKGKLTPPVEIVFSGTSPNLTYTVYDVTNPASPVPLDVGNGVIQDVPYVAGEEIDLGGYSATIINNPVAGDRFSFEYNTDGFSDNRNALAMSNLQSAKLDGFDSYQDAYSGLIERVAGKTAGAKVNVASAKAVMESTGDAIASVSGVNLDEEAARLVQFQQAYQASAQIISTSQTLFETILNI